MPKPIILFEQSGSQVARALQSGEIGSGAVIFGTLASGAVSSGAHAANSVVSGNIASGAVTFGTVASGAVGSGSLGDGAVVSGSIASGQIGSNHLSPGVTITLAKIIREPDNITTAEVISGGFAAALNSSGRAVVALAADSTRMPAVGVEASGAASGTVMTLQLDGRLFTPNFNSGGGGFSGSLGKVLFVSTSGALTPTPPSASGQFQQKVGASFNASGALLRWDMEAVQIIE